MQKQFIPYEQALALEKLGFNEECFGCFIYYGKRNGNVLSISIYESMLKRGIKAPLYQQAFRWFRKNYNLHGYSIPKNGKWDYHILSNRIKYKYFNYSTYEEAELECLKKLIELCQN